MDRFGFVSEDEDNGKAHMGWEAGQSGGGSAAVACELNAMGRDSCSQVAPDCMCEYQSHRGGRVCPTPGALMAAG